MKPGKPSIPRAPSRANFLERLSGRARAYLSDQGVRSQPDGDTPLEAPRGPVEAPSRTRPLRSSEEPSARRRSAPTAREQRRRRGRTRERQAKADSRYLQRLEHRMRSGGWEGLPPRPIPRHVWIRAQHVLADRSGRAANIYLAQQKNRIAAQLIRRAALVPERDYVAGGYCYRYAWADSRARMVAALGLSLLALARRTRRKGVWHGLCRGIPRGALCALLTDPYDRRPEAQPSLSGLDGRHRPWGSWESGEVGWLRALREVGLVYSQQHQADEVAEWEVGPTGYAIARYWLITAEPTAPYRDERKRELIELHALAALDLRQWLQALEDGVHVVADQVARARRRSARPPP